MGLEKEIFSKNLTGKYVRFGTLQKKNWTVQTHNFTYQKEKKTKNQWNGPYTECCCHFLATIYHNLCLHSVNFNLIKVT